MRRAATTGGTSSRRSSTTRQRARASRWTARTCSSSCTRRHDREAEGDRPHDRRLPRRRRDDAPLHLRPEARRATSTGAQPTSAGSPATATSSTGRSATARRRSSTRARRTSRTRTAGGTIVERYGVTILYTAPTAIRAHMKWGPEHAAEARPLVAAAARLGRRADQPRGVDLVPRAHRRRPLPDRRHLVADRDGDDPDHAAAGGHDDEAGLGDEAVPGRRRRRLRRAGRARSGRAVAAISCSSGRGRRCCAGSSATTRATGRRTGRSTPDVYFAGDGARIDADGDFWLLGRVDDVMNVSGHRISTIEVESALVDHPAVAEAAVCWRARRVTGQAIVAFVTLKGGEERLGREARGAAQPRRAEDRRRSRSRRTSSSRRSCRRRAAARSCAGCCATSRRTARSATRRRSPTRPSSPRSDTRRDGEAGRRLSSSRGSQSPSRSPALRRAGDDPERSARLAEPAISYARGSRSSVTCRRRRSTASESW